MNILASYNATFSWPLQLFYNNLELARIFFDSSPSCAVKYEREKTAAKCFSVHNSSFLLQHAYLVQSTLCVFCMCCSESVILRIKGSVFCCKSCHFRVSDPQTRNVNSVNRSRTTCKLSRYQSCRF